MIGGSDPSVLNVLARLLEDSTSMIAVEVYYRDEGVLTLLVPKDITFMSFARLARAGSDTPVVGYRLLTKNPVDNL